MVDGNQATTLITSARHFSFRSDSPRAFAALGYREPGFFTRFVWLAAQRHCPSDEIQVSVKRP